jgi:medium-chain acyl-[acyl-carrier-protein] hydrolase
VAVPTLRASCAAEEAPQHAVWSTCPAINHWNPQKMPPATKGAAINKDPKDAVDSSEMRLNVLCIPQAGMGAWAFHGWQAHMPPGVEVLPVEMPGRNSRILEAKPTDMGTLVSGLVDGLSELGAFSKPYVLLGHSLGGWVAYEILAELIRRGKEGLAQLLIVSGVRAPQLSALEHDADKERPAFAHLSDEEFWSNFERRYGRNPELQGEAMMRMVMPLLRSDFSILENYTPSRETAPLHVPVIACAAVGDSRLKYGQLAAWAAVARDEASFREETFDATPLHWSTPHRYLVESPADFQAFLAREAGLLLDRLGREPPLPSPPPAPHPPSEPSMVVSELLAEAGCSAWGETLGTQSMSDWLVQLEAGRPVFLKMLAQAGVSKLTDRQAIANALGKAKRAGRL